MSTTQYLISVARFSVILLLSLGIAILTACSQSSAPSDSAQETATGADDSASAVPKVPFGHKPCQTLTQEEQRSLGIHAPVPGTASRSPDDLPYENTCSYEPEVGALAIEYTTRDAYDNQRENLRKASHVAPADLPGSFYDVLGNLWFAKDGYYVAVTNVGLMVSVEKVAAVIAAKL